MSDARPSPEGVAVTERVRRLCSALPEVTERSSHGEAAWFVQGKKSFATMADHHHGDRVAVWMAAGEGVQADLIGRHPRLYFRPPYVGVRGWVGAYLDGRDAEPDWDEIAELLGDGWFVVAPAKLRGSLER
ncbi:MAG: MmcQ/YjbR family DNA-binding protein [Acidimicrobiales bacterium]|jgi:hypothetical protein